MLRYWYRRTNELFLPARRLLHAFGGRAFSIAPGKNFRRIMGASAVSSAAYGGLLLGFGARGNSDVHNGSANLPLSGPRVCPEGPGQRDRRRDARGTRRPDANVLYASEIPSARIYIHAYVQVKGQLTRGHSAPRVKATRCIYKSNRKSSEPRRYINNRSGPPRNGLFACARHCPTGRAQLPF